MRRISLAILAIAIGQTAAAAQYCGPHKVITGNLTTKYGETRTAIGLQSNQKLIELYNSDANGTWSIVVTDAKGNACLVAAGKDWMDVKEPVGDPV